MASTTNDEVLICISAHGVPTTNQDVACFHDAASLRPLINWVKENAQGYPVRVAQYLEQSSTGQTD